jgi:hypothetical protein
MCKILGGIERKFTFTLAPFSFNMVLVTTADYPLIFEPQYLHLKTTLPKAHLRPRRAYGNVTENA